MLHRLNVSKASALDAWHHAQQPQLKQQQQQQQQQLDSG
jgi:hypothetical protein